MNRKDYLTKLVNRIQVSFYILLLVTIYEAWYWLAHNSGLSFVLVLLSGAVTYFAYTLMKLFDDIKNHPE
ncbi:hypothetical protein COS21_03655 [bacterium (Candidatus Gribaldobacteria) CG02_land_8_20_14_3_00_41_15]|uniref:Uncharacterized protein n=1 Tax=bacterium (Candidatus Gribaldobacteria) CG02_land_8_20_14_3_00_41_15 TaxID=2014270 RepID=A0A2M7DD08_9BACT|nr:MAG: hypothetical protein AUJ36_02495 [Parcubacteria group bacterium CG1_02_41_26]PIV46760.1 MAG: hypothetical protein COS21_03655 [bacterium (Candidatus Gribaldobacteria) CG02_land_8_20_14_3_00_41_15]